LLLLLFGAIYFAGIVQKDNQTSDEYIHPDSGIGTITLGIGLLDTDGNLIDTGSLLDHEGTLDYTVSFDHFMDSDREYTLVILVDLEQVYFSVDGKETLQYPFNMEANSSINIEITLDVDDENSEVAYLLFKEPNTFFKPQEIDADAMATAMSLETIISLRFSLAGEKEITYTEGYKKVNNSQITELFLSEDPNVFMPIFEKTQGNKLNLSFGNSFSTGLDMAIVQFLDFEQMPFDDGENVHFIHIEPDGIYARELTLPNADEESNYQIVAIHSSFVPTREDFDSLFVFGAYRIVIHP